jgi:signal transduction histidine kinase/DNA-binding response OmpR family regulator
MTMKLNNFTKAIIWITGLLLTVAVEAKFSVDQRQAQSNFHRECQQELRKSADSVGARFHALYADLRTIARMPAVRSSRPTTTFLGDDWADVRELYASMAESTPVRLVRIVPVRSSWTGPYVDTLPLSNRSTGPVGFQKLAANSRQLKLIAAQMSSMPPTSFSWNWNNLQQYPAYSCRPIWMRVSGGPKGKTFGAFVTYYSVPIYSETGHLWGSVSAELPYPTLAAMIPSGDYVLSNPSIGVSVSGMGLRKSATDLLYSEQTTVPSEDRTGRWKLQYNVPLSAFTQRPDISSAQQFRWVAHLIIALITVAAFFVFSSLSKRRSELEEAKHSLEKRVVARTAELAEALNDAKDASRVKGEFLANMSHEIRTPMNGVMAMTELLLRSPLDEEQKDLAQTIASSANSLLTIINDVLDFSKIEARKLVLEQTQFHLASLFEDVVKLHAPAALEKGLEILAELDPSTERIVEGDPVRIRQVASNLLGNAIKFTSSGSVILTAKITGQTKRTLKFSVKDTGAGIPPSRIDAIFESFTQSDASTTRKFGGTGLGLTISRHLAELMGGHIGVHSSLGRGSEFFVSIRIKEALFAVSESSGPADQPRRILVCDDFEPALRVSEAQLTSAGHIVTTCSAAKEAMELLPKEGEEPPFDVLIIDQSIAGEDGAVADGIALCQEINGLECAKSARIILTTTSPGGLPEGILDGCRIDQTLAKPVRKEVLLKAVLTEQNAVETNGPAKKKSTRKPKTTPNVAVEPKPASATRVRKAQPPVPTWAKVLLVEDNAVNQKVARKLLISLGCEVTLAHDGIEAAEMDLRPFDVVLMDCQMPRLDGLSATRQIRHREKRTGDHAIVIALTANAMDDDQKNCMEAGMDDYLSKPLRRSELEQILHRHLKPETQLPQSTHPESRVA